MPAGRLLFRFTIGLMQLTAQRLGSVLRAASATRPPATGDEGCQARGARLRDIAVGSLVAIPGAIIELRTILAARTVRLRRLARRYGRVRADLPSIPRGLARVELWEARAAERLDQLADAGQREQAAGLSLAAGVVKRLIAGGAAQLVESSAVKRSSPALPDLRDRSSARPDDERVNLARRILRMPREEPA